MRLPHKIMIISAIVLAVSIASAFDLNFDTAVWRRNGPFAAYVTSLALAPSTPEIVYIGTRDWGVYKSTNSAENWDQCSTGELPLPVPIIEIAVNPMDSEHLWIGIAGNGLYESQDGGDSWQKAHSSFPDSITVTFIHIDENDPDEIYVGACGMGGPFGIASDGIGGVYKTTDGGDSWILMYNVPYGYGELTRATTFAKEPGSEDTLYVGITGLDYYGFAAGLMRSTDDGNNWEMINDMFAFYDLQINPDNTQEMWSIIYTGYNAWLLAFSTDGGYTWTAYPDWINVEIWVTQLFADNDFSLYKRMKVFDDPNIKEQVKKSIDAGNTWTNIDTLMAGRRDYFRNLSFDANPDNPDELYFGTKIGVYKSLDGGFNCEPANTGLYNAYIREIESHPHNNEILYACSFQGLWKSIDAGESWQRKSEEGVSTIEYDPIYPDTLYYSGSSKGLMRSFDGGETWEDIGHNIAGGIFSISINPVSTNEIYVVSGIDALYGYKSENYGDSWELIFSWSGHICVLNAKIIIDPNNPEILYFARTRSLDGGNNWENVPGVSGGTIVGVHPHNSDILYHKARPSGVLMISYDWGESWEDFGPPFLRGLIFDENDSDKIFLCTRTEGIVYTVDAGESWQTLEGDYYISTREIIPFYDEGKVYIATWGDGVWIGENLFVSAEDDIVIHQPDVVIYNYPNPFNPDTTIKLELAEAGRIELSIYNIKGQKVRNLLDAHTEPGIFICNWNGRDDNGRPVSSGQYLIKLKQNDEVTVEKMMLLK